MQRIHHTHVKGIAHKSVRKYPQDLTDKPNGLWYGIDWAWMRFCKTEMRSTYKVKKNHFLIELDMKRILVIDNSSSFKSFAEMYAENPSYLVSPSGSNPQGFYINWNRVASKYAGIEISPYRGEFRRTHRWYYCWDIPCGCVWDLKAIKSVEKVNNQLKPAMAMP